MRIQYDTNGDGILDSNDNGMLFAYDVQKKEEYPLTLIEEPSATPRWVSYADGVIVYSIVEGQYINIAMIPHTGIIPKQKNALRQYELALKYKEDLTIVTATSAVCLLHITFSKNPVILIRR